MFLILADKNYGISAFALGIAFISVALGKKAIQLGKKSDAKMSAMANVKFMEASDIFEENKNLSLGLRPFGSRSYSIWKCRRKLEQTIKLKKWVYKTQRNEIASYYSKLIKDLIKQSKSQNFTPLDVNERNDIRLIFESIKKLDIDKKYKINPKELFEMKEKVK